MKLWLISQDPKNVDYDTYDSAVVAAETEELARMTHPNGWDSESYDGPWSGVDEGFTSWCDAVKVVVEYIGEAKEGTKAGVICASFNAG